MRNWFRGKRGGFIAFLVIAALVAGGLGWVTDAALRLEAAQHHGQAEAELQARLRLALWRLDSYMIPELAREASRPFADYSALYIPSPLLDSNGVACAPGSVRGVSPLLNSELPEWMLLHFSAPVAGDWWSPQVLTADSRERLNKVTEIPRGNDKVRESLLQELKLALKPKDLVARIGKQETDQSLLETQAPVQQTAQAEVLDINNNLSNFAINKAEQMNYGDYQARASRVSQDKNLVQRQQSNPASNTFYGHLTPNNEHLWANITANTRGKQVVPGPMTALWVKTTADQERLMIARRVRVGETQVAQGIVLNWDALEKLLLGEVHDLFPHARLQATHGQSMLRPERTMTALPVELFPGESAVPIDPGWSPLRIGLAIAWVAALIALSAVGLGGWSLIDLSQRRTRFVSTVTHELRTPLTTLRLYLDMLTGGMVKDDQQRAEYLLTLNCETDRLNRLVNNVLDFSRLERQSPELEKMEIRLNELLADVAEAWQARCKECAKELIVENHIGLDATLCTDKQLLQQVLGNLIDNACKYSRGAADSRIWLRVFQTAGDRIAFEVEDRGPGVARRERKAIFRPFRRGRQADVTAAGVGLGLALACRWTKLLGGQLSVKPGQDNVGACFRVESPARR